MPGYRQPSDWGFVAAGFFMAAVGCGLTVEARATETVRLFSAGAAQGAILRLEPAIAAASSSKLDPVFDTVGALRDRLLRGEATDVAILSEAGILALEKAGKIAGGPVVDLGRISVALAVRRFLLRWPR